MDNYKKYYGVLVFVLVVAVLLFGSYYFISPIWTDIQANKSQMEKKLKTRADLQEKLNIVQAKIKKIKNSIVTSQKRIYAPTEADLGNETLFFTLYNDVIEMVKSNSIKIKSINYVYNPESDAFVEFGKDVYFVCDVEMDLVSNYYNIGKLIEDIYKYNYYIRINELEVEPYEKDKTVLLSHLSLRLYAHTDPQEDIVDPAM